LTRPGSVTATPKLQCLLKSRPLRLPVSPALLLQDNGCATNELVGSPPGSKSKKNKKKNSSNNSSNNAAKQSTDGDEDVNTTAVADEEPDQESKV
jgi:hypothetical protein